MFLAKEAPGPGEALLGTIAVPSWESEGENLPPPTRSLPVVCKDS
jgi:hypothetical protein